ncbi:MAG TPA: DUF3106 domain-containing protein [Bryobacteraceae bacterium]|nr:DUF3106 domain-containing protein [Bryobacteraceae bacterium]
MPGLRIALIVAIAGASCYPLVAQNKKSAPPPKPAQAPRNAPYKGNRPPQESPIKELDRFSKMSPDQQAKELSKLPPARRAAVEQRLERYQKLTPEQQEQFKQRLELMQSLPRDRQNAVRYEIQRLRALPPQQRRSALNGEEFGQNYSPDEQRLIRDAFPGMQPRQGREF